MDIKALKTIQIHNWGFDRDDCVAVVNNIIEKISAKYPKGVDRKVYFVIPGYEHVTRNQPIIRYNIEAFELSTINKFGNE